MTKASATKIGGPLLELTQDRSASINTERERRDVGGDDRGGTAT